MGVTVVSDSRVRHGAIVTLTPAEWDVLSLRALGLTTLAVAERRGTSRDTVRNQIDSIHAKTGATCLVDALRAVGWLVVP